jgi:hypothetical protein
LCFAPLKYYELVAPGGNGCAEIPVRDLVVLVMLEERGVPDEALLDAVSAGREGRAYVMLVFFLF